jgi:hypothetical protein
MKIDIPLAGWILSVATFLLGTILPVVYGRFAFDGISVQQLSNVRSVSTDLEQGTNEFSTLLKVANVNRDAIVVEGLGAPDISVSGFSFKPLRTEFKFFTKGETIALPPSHPIVLLNPDGSTTTNIPESVKPVAADFPPLIIKSNEDKLLGITIYFACRQFEKKNERAIREALYNYIVENGLGIRIRINGKYRPLKLQILPI